MSIPGFSKRRFHLHTPHAIRSTVSLFFVASLAACLSATSLLSQTSEAIDQPTADSATVAAVPRMIKYSGTLLDGRGYPITIPVDVTFALYGQAASDSTAALWKETQHIAPTEKGSFTIYLGAASNQGLPTELFTSSSAQWLGVQAEGEREQPRVLLVSVPYAFKAGDAQTLGGLPASAFMLAETLSQAASVPVSSEAGNPPPAALAPTVSPQLVVATPVTTPGGTSGYVPVFSGTSAIVNSPVSVSGSAIAMGALLSPASLTLHGPATFFGKLNLPSAALATSSTGQSSQALEFSAAGYNSISSQSVPQNFLWQAVPVGNNTISPSAALNLLFASGSYTPTATGLSIGSTGKVTFAAGQTFPGTVTGVTAGTALTGGGTTGGALTLSLDTTKVPLLAANNIFSGNQYFGGGAVFSGSVAVQGSLMAETSFTTPVLNATTYELGGVIFATGSQAKGDAYLGFAGGAVNTGSNNTAVGSSALRGATSSSNSAFGAYALTTLTGGAGNTAIGAQALYSDSGGIYDTALGYNAGYSTTGSENTAVGVNSMSNNTTGSQNTAIGFAAGPPLNTGSLSNSTAIGAGSIVGQSNSLVLGQTQVGNPGAVFVNVGVGTATPLSAMEISVNAPGALGPTLTLTNPGGVTSTQYDYASLDFNTQPIPASGTYNPGARIAVEDDARYSDHILFQSKAPGATANSLQTNMIIASGGQVIVGGGLSQIEGTQFETVAQPGLTAIIARAGATPRNDDSVEGGIGIVASGGAGLSVAVPGGLGAYIEGGNSGGTGIVAFGGSGGDGIVAHAGSAFEGFSPLAGVFDGDVSVGGTLSSANDEVRIDHPLDPANKLLVHSSIQSSEMVNIYSGNAVTDELGIATVQLPDWFEALNADFRYQLTVVGRKAQAWISEEVQNHRFVISSDATNAKVSWQITAVRQDPYAKAHPIVVEQAKSEQLRGYFIHPELYGQPEEKGEQWARHPQMMRQRKAAGVRARTLAESGGRDSRTAESMAPASAVRRPVVPIAVRPMGPENHPPTATKTSTTGAR